MEEQQSNPTSNTSQNFAIFSLLVTLFCSFFGAFMYFTWPNLDGLGMIFISGLCGIPLSLVLFFSLKSTDKIKKSYQRFLFPALGVPLIVGLLITWTLIQQRPEHIVRVFVVDPIPEGVSNIHARDISAGIDREIIGWFNATPKAIEEIIIFNQMEMNEDSGSELESHFEIFYPNLDLNQDWIRYNRDYSKNGLIIFVELWVNPEKNTVVFFYGNW
jgi:hypothetical protein